MLVRDALAPHATDEPAIDGTGTVLRWRKIAGGMPMRPPSRPAPEPIEIPASDLASVREKLASIEASLGAIAG